jgi:hypothetical protein
MEKEKTDLMRRTPSVEEKKQQAIQGQLTATYNFDDLRWPVHRLEMDSELLLKFPEFRMQKDIAAYPHPDRNKLLRYMIYLYDEHSPLPRIHPDLHERKLWALRLAGYLLENENLNEQVQKVYALATPEIARIARAFISMQKSREFKLKLAIEQVHEENLSMLLSPDLFVAEPKEEEEAEEPKGKRGKKKRSKPTGEQKLLEATQKSKLIDICTKTLSTLEQLDKKLYGTDEVLQQAVEESIVQEKVEQEQQEEEKKRKIREKKKVKPISPENITI